MHFFLAFDLKFFFFDVVIQKQIKIEQKSTNNMLRKKKKLIHQLFLNDLCSLHIRVLQFY